MSTVQTNRKNILRLTELGLLAALIFLLSFTPLGYLKIGPLSMTLLPIPVTIGAVLLGPAGGAILGFLFGLTSFLQCFGMDWLGTTLMGMQPIFMTLTCFVSRLLMGWLAGWIFRGLRRIDKTNLVSYGVTCLSGALLNTLFFMSLLLLFFTPFLMEQFAATSIWALLVTMVGINGIAEAILCTVVGAAVAKALMVVNQKYGA